MSNVASPQQSLRRFALRVASWQVFGLLISATILFFIHAGSLRLAISLFAGGIASVTPFLVFAAILISAGFANKSKLALRFFLGVFVKFILSATMLWIAYFYINLNLWALLSGFMLAYLILLCLPKAKWLRFHSTAVDSGVQA